MLTFRQMLDDTGEVTSYMIVVREEYDGWYVEKPAGHIRQIEYAPDDRAPFITWVAYDRYGNPYADDRSRQGIFRRVSDILLTGRTGLGVPPA